ncbi:MAG: hypothetical protein C4297_08370 [Gemmataceae bacterium]
MKTLVFAALSLTVTLASTLTASAQEMVMPAGHVHVLSRHDCAAPCGPVCVPVTDKRVVTKTVYHCKEEPFCLPRCRSLLDLLCFWRCDSCDTCVECEPPRTRKVLLKKIVKHEESVVRCVLQQPEAKK